MLLHRDTDIISPRVLLCIAKQRELCTRTTGSLESIRVTVGINMGVQVQLLIIDWKEFWVMSTCYQTCGVTRLSITSLLSTKMFRSMRECHRNGSENIEIVTERNQKSSGSSGKSRENLKAPEGSRKVLEYSRTF